MTQQAKGLIFNVDYTRKAFIVLAVVYFALSSAILKSQNRKLFNIDFTDPKSVVNAIFYAAQTHDYTILQCLCDPYGQGDGDTKQLCSISAIANQIDEYGGSEKSNLVLKEFNSIFELGRVNGQVTFENGETGLEFAKVPIWINHPGGESRSEETMILVKRHGNWYLSSF